MGAVSWTPESERTIEEVEFKFAMKGPNSKTGADQWEYLNL